jgi:hypothetical protein
MGPLSFLIHHSGGLVYHFRAWRFKKRLWSGHLQNTRQFLMEWNPKSDHLVLVGPSAGYSLPIDFLKRFKKITAFEPDPIARFLFRFRTGLHPHWITAPFSFEDLNSEKIQLPIGSAVLFCNVLGQKELNQDEGMLAQNEIESLAQQHELASYHDILSGDDFRFQWESPTINDQPVRYKFDAEALDPYFEAAPGITELDLHVHSANYLFQSVNEPADESFYRHQYWEWQISPTQTQVIEGVYTS